MTLPDNATLSRYRVCNAMWHGVLPYKNVLWMNPTPPLERFLVRTRCDVAGPEGCCTRSAARRTWR